MRDYYARRAREYDQIYERAERQADLALLRGALSRRFAQRRVLDVACGTGYWTACYADSALSVLGVDANQTVLDVLIGRDLPHCATCLGDCYALGEELGQFDAAFVGFWISHVARADRGRFFASLHRRLLPGARVVMIDNRFVEGSSTPIELRDAAGDTWQLRALADGSTHRVLKNFPRLDELLEPVTRHAAATHWWQTEYFWWFEYELKSP
jgi:ubiquinone/menaquinone biosynthesis C-methylase UbiE